MSESFGQTPLAELCDILDKKRKPITKRDRKPGPYPYYGATGVLDHVESYIFDEPLILVGEDGAKWDAGEKTAYGIFGKSWVNNHAHVLRPKREKVLDAWLIYYLNASDLSKFITGLTVPKLNQAKLREIPIPLPPLPEQKRIVAILDEAFAGIATAIANTEKNLANARELFESYLNSIFKHEGYGWCKSAIGEQVTLQRGFDITKKDQRAGRVPVISSGGIKSYHDTSKVSGPGVIIGRKGSLGTVFYIEGEFWPHDTTLWVKDFKDNNPKLVFYFFRALDVKRFDSGTANPSLNRNMVHPIETSWPLKNRQDELVKQLDYLACETGRLESIYQQKLTALAELKQSLLQKAFSGELTAEAAAKETEMAVA